MYALRSKLEQCFKQSLGCFRFDALKLLDALRDKRVMFIGDSVQRSTFESMVCMVQSVIPDNKKSFHRVPPMKIFKAEVHKTHIFRVKELKLVSYINFVCNLIRNTMCQSSITGRLSSWNRFQIMQLIIRYTKGWSTSTPLKNIARAGKVLMF